MALLKSMLKSNLEPVARLEKQSSHMISIQSEFELFSKWKMGKATFSSSAKLEETLSKRLLGLVFAKDDS